MNTIEVNKKSIPGKPDTWPKGSRNSEQCLCGSKQWHGECYRAMPINSMSPRSIMSHAGMKK